MFNSHLHDKIERLEKKITELQEIITNGKEANRAQAEKITSMASEFEIKYAQALKSVELDHRQKMLEQKSTLEELHKAAIDKIKDEYNKKIVTLNEEHYSKLKDSLQKLHEEGNATSKFMEQSTLKMMEVVSNIGSNRPLQLSAPEQEGTTTGRNKKK